MIQLPNTEVYLIEVPKETKNFTIIESHSYFPSPRVEHSTGGVDLPKGTWEILGLITADSIGFDVEPYLDGIANALTKTGRSYYDYSRPDLNYTTSDDHIYSFRSLLTSLNISTDKCNWLAVEKK